ncbi:hypothetical protein E2C01_011309 [Portunus trituberculatus]|uniref:Uncharacterized protein n=1 Tax=Portunus trituberculatus TaxID=210409 RepID=A0A5B7DAR8_PORTR|nr:hypothetical protein [Portunus trituberculatus]
MRLVVYRVQHAHGTPPDSGKCVDSSRAQGEREPHTGTPQPPVPSPRPPLDVEKGIWSLIISGKVSAPHSWWKPKSYKMRNFILGIDGN